MPRENPDRILTTVLFTDIVSSAEAAEELGDIRWREFLRRHHALVRQELKQFEGREVDTAGDGFFATFVSPADAVRCACAIADSVRSLGIEIRSGLHFGECELLDGKVSGIVVHTGARVMSLGGPGEVLITSTTRDLVAGSCLDLEDRGTHQLKGIQGEWHLYAVTGVDGRRREPTLDREALNERRKAIDPQPFLPRRGYRGRAGAVAAAMVLAAAVIAGVAVFLRGGDNPIVPGINTVTRIDPTIHMFDTPIKVGVYPTGVAWGEGSVWVINRTDRTIDRVDPSMGEVSLARATPGTPTGVAVGAGGVWITSGFGTESGADFVARLDPRTQEISSAFAVDVGMDAVAADDGSVWVVDSVKNRVWRYDTVTGNVLKIPVEEAPSSIAIGGEPTRVWVVHSLANLVSRIDPVSETVDDFGVQAPAEVAVDDDAVWVTSYGNDTVTRIDPQSGRIVIRIPVPNGPTGIAVGADGVWVACSLAGEVVMIDPATNKVVVTLRVNGIPDRVAADGDGAVWVTVHEQ